MQSESYIDLIADWLPTEDAPHGVDDAALQKLARVLEQSHGDPWLSDFVHFSPSLTSNGQLKAAIADNLVGNHKSALQEATSVRQTFATIGNNAGLLRSELEAIYALRRQQKGQECRDRYSSLPAWFLKSRYLWLRIRISIEVSGCLAMTNDFDRASLMAKEAAQDAKKAAYPSLELRALGYLASFHTSEGRLQQSWEVNQAGLHTYWSDVFSHDRAYQFYADLEFAAEKAEQWHLAAVLQREALEQFRDSKRLDFKASAHCRMARMNEMTGDLESAQKEFDFAFQHFQELDGSSERPLYEADCRIAQSSLEARFGTIDSALRHLSGVQQIVEHTENFAIRLRYEKAWADIERRRENWESEQKHLQQAISIGNRGFRKLKSSKDRWDWRREVGEAYRQLLEREAESSHPPDKTFADWEAFRSIDTRDTLLPSEEFGEHSLAQNAISDRLKQLRHGTIVAFAIFRRNIVAWVADDRGVYQFRISIDSETLTSTVREFRYFCSNPLSPSEKVNSAGSRLYKLLVGPIEHKLDPTRTLFIEADQVLGLLPWQALVQTDGTYLGRNFTIVNTPGLLSRELVSTRSNTMENVLVAYPGAVELEDILYQPLPHAKEEADYVASLYPKRHYLQNTEVTSQHLLEELVHTSLFHFAGHAITRQYNGELIIHGKNDGDVLSASSFADTKIRAKLIVLSACDTAGNADPARDPNGLVHALLSAGAERVIATQWDIDSGVTSGLIQHFYQSLKEERLPPENALHGAWKHVSSSSDASHPYYWAGFQVFGPVTLN